MSESKKPLILLVEDNPHTQQYLKSVLSKDGYALSMIRQGEDAMEEALQNEPHLVLLDIVLPGMDGYEVCKQLKAHPLTRHIPVIFLTAKNSTDDIVKAFEAGAVDHVSKPFNPPELLARVRTHVDMKALRGLLPICSHCKSIRDDEGMWKRVEAFLESHSEALLSHSLCPGCMDELYPEFKQRDKEKK